MARYVIRIARQASLIALFVSVAILGIVSGAFFAYAGDLPQITALDDYAPSTITRIYAAGGEVIGEFATERRVVIGYDDIPPRLRQAIIAAEDAAFNSHFGLSITRIAVTAVRDIVQRRMAGASTLTQQLARALFLTQEKTWERKIKEAILTVQIEKRYTKPEILTLYCNQIYFGHGAYGVEAASRLYFGKSARDLTLEEAALIAGIIQMPSRQSPFVDPARAKRRRDYVLQRMRDEGYITAAEAAEAQARPIVTVGRRREQSIAPFFVEEVRQYLEAHYGVKPLYEGGLSVATSLDVNLQKAATRAVREGLRRVDRRRGFRRPTRNVTRGGGSPDAFADPRWRRPMAVGDRVPAVVTGVEPTRIMLRIGSYHGTVGRDGFRWTRQRSATRLVRTGDLVEVQITAIDQAAQAMTATLDQEPLVEGALLAVNNRTGQVLAMVGGYDFERSKFNRAVQASRQLGSLFKAVVYTTAIDRGYTPTSIIVDEPVSFPAGPGQPAYTPRNYDHKFEGPITLRHALEKSRNVPAVRMMDALGADQVVAYARRFGFTSELPPFLSVALGAAEATLREITSAYSVFPNQGVRMEPYQILKITDREGNVLETNRPVAHDVVPADTAFVMTNLLRGVIRRGTGVQAASIRWPLAGKTGTVDNYTDAWFVGFDPDITVGVWVGYDEKKTLGPGEEGARVALPIWSDVMRAYIGDRTDPPEFPQPANIVFLSVDRRTGTVAEPAAPDAIREAFIAGTEPGTAFQP